VFQDFRTRDAILPEVKLGLDTVPTLDGVEIHFKKLRATYASGCWLFRLASELVPGAGF
jgi:hypothetical protein